ncbi:LacI family DNA-binding transcriptional regulator [Fulvivirgaceae bacterium BMA12]|uniref:LacI family DNA-binding transcriptional regulator n=1 Tax=Agaribacillus aureus TaxID=3051825 RepID=A0ABT8LIV1_9BACT|nr:LacI family DNA-binding transcriptional regulator [Fulvivirgaceae bacterium BMA12]
MTRYKTTLRDLAFELGVSQSTVSRALNNDQRISEKTRKAVQELAKKLDYAPNPFALKLLKNESNSIGLILPEFKHHFFANVLEGIHHVVSDNGFQLLIHTHHGDAEKEIKYVKFLNNLMVDGIITCYSKGSDNFDHYKTLVEESIPLVFIDRLCEDIDATSVITDDFSGAVEAVNYLVKTGCRHIAHFMGPENLSTSFSRLTGYKEGLLKNGIRHTAVLEWEEEKERYREHITQFLSAHKTDAIFCFNDYIAYELLLILEKTGRKVPDDVSVIGFSNEPISEYFRPRISTVAQPATLMGERAAHILIDTIRHPAKENRLSSCLPTELIIRETTKPL